MLQVKKYPNLTFRSSRLEKLEENYCIHGELTICCVSRLIECVAHRQGEHFVMEVDLNQLDFGIKPFKALMGTLKVSPDVKV